MHPGILAICVALLSALNTAHAQLLTLKAPVLACIAPERLVCGCSIRLAGVPCTKQAFSSQPHLFTELQPNAPLLITLDGEELSIAHVSHFGTSIKGDPPGHSTDVYSSPMLKATVQYSPMMGPEFGQWMFGHQELRGHHAVLAGWVLISLGVTFFALGASFSRWAQERLLMRTLSWEIGRAHV